MKLHSILHHTNLFRHILTVFLTLFLIQSPCSLHAQSETVEVESEQIMVSEGEEASGENSPLASVILRIQSAGIVGLLILLMSVISLAFAFAQFSQLRRSQICPDGVLEEVSDALLSGNIVEAESKARASNSLLGKTLLAVIDHREFDFSEVSTIAGDVATRELKKHLQRNFPMLVVATSATLLGLLGTVIGMIRSFEAVAMAGELGNPSIMAADISYALVTTAMGLSVALPSLIFYHYFRNRIQSYGVELDEVVSDFISSYFKQQKATNRDATEDASLESTPA